MKEKIANILVIVVMVVIANYPLYTTLKKTADEVNIMIEGFREELAYWKKDADNLKNKITMLRNDIILSVDSGLSQTSDVLDKINGIEANIDGLYNKIDNIKLDAVKNVEDKVDFIKEEPIDSIKDLFKIKG